MNDSVREELTDRISPIAKSSADALNGNYALPPPAPLPFVVPPQAAEASAPPVPPAPPAASPIKFDTAEITSKPTSPTLVEFQTKSAALPDWRLELQNAVRKRRDARTSPVVAEPVHAVSQTVLSSNGSAALKAEVVAYAAPKVAGNEKLEGALKRIEESRRRFLNGETAPPPPPAPAATAATADAPAPAAKNYPFYIATKNAAVQPKPIDIKPPATLAPRPVIEDLPIIEKKDLDTNKLKPLPNSAIIASSLERSVPPDSEDFDQTDAPLITISRVIDDFDEEYDEQLEAEGDEEFEEVDDVAPLGMRFNAAVLDLIIGSFASLILLAPLMISGGNWFSLAGLLAFGVTCSIVMFIYLTTAVGFFGQTLGMRLFALEVLDIDEEEYPSLHQAAVNSSVYLVSLAFGGLGFIPVLFNEEKRAAHDLLSGTIVVREEI